MKENNENMTKLWVGIVLAIAFLVQSQFRNEIATLLLKLLPFASDMAYLLLDVLVYVAFFLCLCLVLHAYTDVANRLKMAGIVVGIWVIEFLLPWIGVNEAVLLAYAIVWPLLVVALLLLAFFWVTKKRLASSKAVVISAACLFAGNVIFNVAEYFYLMSSTNIMQLLIGNPVFSTLSSACFYGLIFVTFWWMINSERNTATILPGCRGRRGSL